MQGGKLNLVVRMQLGTDAVVIRDINGIKVSERVISQIMEKVLEEAKDWQQRPPGEYIYPMVEERSRLRLICGNSGFSLNLL